MEDLIFDRSQSDVDHVIDVTRRISNGTASDEETAEFLQGRMKGSWNYTDLNRIESWTAYLYDVLLQYGYTAVITPRHVERPGESRLPEGYTELTYIQSSGTQYVDTGVKIQSNAKVIAKMEYTVMPTGADWAALFGSRNGSGSQEYWVYYRPEDNEFSLKYGNDTSNYLVPGNPTAWNSIIVNGNTLSIEDQSVSAQDVEIASINNLYIFGVNNSGSVQYKSQSALAEYAIYNNGVIVRDFVPCKDPSGTVGLYDLVNNAFYSNSGAGTFTAGDIVPPTPSPLDPSLWYETDIPTRSEIDRIRANVDALQTGFQSLADWRDIIYNNTMDYGQANALEWDLQRIYDWLQAMANGFLTKQANTLFMVAGGVFNN